MYELYNFIGILLPELENNIFYMDSVMKRYGYYAAVKAGYKQDGMYWTYVIYNPVDKFNCNEWIKNKISMLYHITSVEAANKITETGLLPFMSHGENRVYLYGNDYHNKQFLEMMIGSLKTRHGTTTGAIIPVRPTVVNSVDFYYDPNFSQAVFCTDPISTEYIDIDGIMVVNLQTIL